MGATITTNAGTQVVCRDQVGNVVSGEVVSIEAGACRGGGIAYVKAIWPGRKRATVQLVELADVEVAS